MKNSKWNWLYWILAGSIVLAALIEFVLWLQQQSGFISFDDWVNALGWGVALPVVFSVLATLIITRQPGNRVGWLMLLVALTRVAPFQMILGTLPSSPPALTPGIFLLLWLDAWGWIPIIFPIFLIPLNFPTGFPPSRRWNWVNGLALGMWLVFILLIPFVDPISPNSGEWSLPNPIGFIPLKVINGPFMIVWGIGLITLVSASVVSLYVRFRRAVGRERQQIEWLLYAGALFVVLYALTFVMSSMNSQFTALENTLLLLSILTIPFAIAIAILRYRLYEIDIIIRKTLQYGVLTALLALVYFGSVLLLQNVVEKLTGKQSPVVIVISTLAIAGLFNPLRLRVQTFIDRRFYRRKYDAEKALARFAVVARDEVDMDQLSASLLNTVEETIQPESVSLWLK